MRSPLSRLSPADYVSALNGMFGFLAISFYVKTMMVEGAIMTSMALFMDGLDGVLARRFGSPHSRGMQVDSIADTISFCVAPAVALYIAYRGGYTLSPLSLTSAFVASVYVFFGILRLGAFSRDGYRLKHFVGLPTPSATLMITSMLLMMGNGALHYLPWIGLFISFFVSVLMVTGLKYPKPRGMLAAGSVIVLLIFTAVLAIGDASAVLYVSALLFVFTSAYVIGGPIYCMLSGCPK